MSIHSFLALDEKEFLFSRIGLALTAAKVLQKSQAKVRANALNARN